MDVGTGDDDSVDEIDDDRIDDALAEIDAVLLIVLLATLASTDGVAIRNKNTAKKKLFLIKRKKKYKNTRKRDVAYGITKKKKGYIKRTLII